MKNIPKISPLVAVITVIAMVTTVTIIQMILETDKWVERQITPDPTTTSGPIDKYFGEDYGNKINMYRLENEIAPLSYNQMLFVSASKAAREIANFERSWSHEGFEGDVMQYYGEARVMGENLARGYDNFNDVLKAWKDSPSHNALLLSQRPCEYGVGHYGNVWVLHTACKN